MSRVVKPLGLLAILLLLAARASAEGAPFPISPDAGMGFKIHIFDKERKPGEKSGIEKLTEKLKAHNERMAKFKEEYGDRQDKQANRAYWRAFFNRKPKAPGGEATASAGGASAFATAAAGVEAKATAGAGAASAPASDASPVKAEPVKAEPVPPKAIPVADGETE